MKVTINGWPISTPFHAVDSVHKFPHQGIDFAIPQGTPIPSLTDGVVSSVANEGSKSFGTAVHVHLQNGTDVIYGHLSKVNVHSGQSISAGDTIGLSGNTGHSTGPHLHLQVMQNGHAVDPSTIINASPQVPIPWWDLEGHATHACQDVLTWLGNELHVGLLALGHGLVNLLDIGLPTLALVGVIWWMCPFLPKSDKSPKLVGLSLIAYMFFTIVRWALA